MKEIPISKLKSDFDKILKQVHRTKRPVRITYRGKKVADILFGRSRPILIATSELLNADIQPIQPSAVIFTGIGA